MVLKNIFLLSFFIQFSLFLSAQNISMDQTLTYINGKLAGKYTLDVKNGSLLVTAFKEEKKMMEEVILISDLDEQVIYSAEEGSLIMKCTEGDKCVQRKEYLVEKKNYFSRVKIVTPTDERSVKGLQNAFLHMIKLVHIPKYKNAEPFE